MARRNLEDARIVVTGASSGIGRALAIQLCQRGAHVLATARRAERLLELQRTCEKTPGQLTILEGDLTSERHRQEILDQATSQWNALDVLVNNAGAGAIGRFDGASSNRLRRVMEIDFFAPVELTRLCLPLLERGRRPAILNIGSVLSHRAVPNKSEYCAAKFAMRGWAESLRVELATPRSEVLMLSPSTTRSECLDGLVDTKVNEKSKSVGSMLPERVAQLAISTLILSKREMILSFGGKCLVWAGRLFPQLTDRILGRFA
ncbi:MAG TPA: SDR family NAD(P)-dependent oxidoreductase [Pirellula sp.]|nr:SDR family NAD(P)-dependent oxidoreductase [Pirellula sp.]